MKVSFPATDPVPWLKPGVFLVSLLPIPVMIWRASHGQLGADIIAAGLNRLGYLTLVFLTASLLCTPLKLLAGWSWGLRLRRMLGLFSVFYGSLHFLVYILLDQSLNFTAVWEDMAKRKFILVGFLTYLILLLLATTSTDRIKLRLGAGSWKHLHWLTYMAGCLGALHYIWRVKVDLREPLVFAGLIWAFLLIRLINRFRIN